MNARVLNPILFVDSCDYLLDRYLSVTEPVERVIAAREAMAKIEGDIGAKAAKIEISNKGKGLKTERVIKGELKKIAILKKPVTNGSQNGKMRMSKKEEE